MGSFGGVSQVSALFINTLNSSLLIGTHALGMFEHRETKDHTGKATLTTHDGSCNQALYNPLFDIVSCVLVVHCYMKLMRRFSSMFVKRHIYIYVRMLHIHIYV